ncbi:MAG: hypothetical protein ACXVW4_10505 [Nocardioides sp.]
MRTPLRILGAVVATSVAAVAVPLLSSSEAQAVKFTGGNLVVYRVGAGTDALSNAAAPVFLDEFTASGSKVRSIALPTAASGTAHALTAVGQSRSEGLLATGPNGLLAVTGYDAAPGTTGPGGTSLTASDPAAVGRVVGIVDAAGKVDTSTVLTGAGAPQIVRSAVTDGTRVWAAGGNGGVLASTIGSGTTSTVAGDAGSNLTALTVQAHQLFAGGVLADRLTKVGTGTPTSGATLTDLPGLPENLLTYGYALLDLTAQGFGGTPLDTLYVADASSRGGTVDKYAFDGTTWRLAGYVDVPDATGLVADTTGDSVSLAVTTPTQLLALTDAHGSSASSFAATPSVLATAPSGTEFRGVALAPTGTYVAPGNVLTHGTFAWTDKRVARTGTWKTYAVAKAPGGKGLSSTRKGSKVTAFVRGTKLALTLGTGPRAGKVRITLDGKSTTVDLYAAKAGTAVRTLTLSGATDPHKLVVTVLGTKRAASAGTAVALALLKVS